MTHYRVYKDSADEWRWQCVATNGYVLATSGEGHKNKSHAVEMATKLAAGATVVFED